MTSPTCSFIAPRSGALGWIDTYALPAQGRNDEAAYAWINFVLRPDIAARIGTAVGNFTSVKAAEPRMPPRLREQFARSFPPAARKAIRGTRPCRPASRPSRARCSIGYAQRIDAYGAAIAATVRQDRREEALMSQAGLEVEHVRKHCHFVAVEDLSLTVAPPGQLLFRSGPSGCGKTFFINR